MSDRVDELFDGGSTPPPAPVVDPHRGLRRLVYACLVLHFVGPITLLSVPAALLNIWAWYQADEAVGKARMGLYAPAQAQEARRLKKLAFDFLVVGFCMLLVQIAVLSWIIGRLQGEATPPGP